MTHHLLTESQVRPPRNLKDSTGHQTSESPGGHRLLSYAKDAGETDTVMWSQPAEQFDIFVGRQPL